MKHVKHKQMAGLVDPGVVAGWFNVSRNTVLNWAKSGEIPAIIIGKTYRFDPNQLVESGKLPKWILN